MSGHRLSTARAAVVAALIAAGALLGAAPAGASSTQESILQDDPLLLGPSAQQVDSRIATMKALGVDRIRVSLFWDHVAPANKSQTKPAFPSPGASSPAAYPRGSWETYDRIVLSAARHGIGLLFTITGPGPAWATPGRQSREGITRPSPTEFRAFVKAAGRRYSGHWPVGDQPVPATTDDGLLGLGGLGSQQQSPRAVPRIPRVDHWSVWNEPNFPTWLAPVWLNNRPKKASQMVAAAPNHYRQLVDAAFAGLDASGHSGDTVLIGETAPRGGKKPNQLGNAMAPAEFVRELYCLTSKFRAYRGRAASLRGCPASGRERSRFRSAHPGLFRAKGYAHHPYSLAKNRWEKPTWRHPLKDNVPIANLARLTRTLDRAAFYWGSSAAPMKLWITEYGYQTKPPDPLVGVGLSRQGPLTSWGEYMAYRNRRVASVAQFLLVDDAPRPGFANNDRRRWITWQSGMIMRNGRAKPSLQEYQRPIHLIGRGRNIRVFGAYRPAPNGVPIAAQIQFSSAGGAWRGLRSLAVRNAHGYLNARVRLPGRGLVRVLWRDPVTGALVGSRPVPAG